MIKIKIGESEVNIPTSWRDVSLGQIIELRKTDEWRTDNIRLLSILTTPFTVGADGKPTQAIGDYKTEGTPEYLWTYANAETVETKIMPLMKFLEQAYDFEQCPKLDYLKSPSADYRYKVPKDLKLCTYGQKIYAAQLIKAKGATDIVMAELLCLYLEPEVSGWKFNSDTFEKELIHVMNLPSPEAFPVGTFFIRTLFGLPMNGVEPVSSLQRVTTKRQTLRNLIGSGNTAHFTSWLKAIFSASKKLLR